MKRSRGLLFIVLEQLTRLPPAPGDIREIRRQASAGGPLVKLSKMHQNKLVRDNIRKGMGQWADYCIDKEIFPLILVTIGGPPEAKEVAYIKHPTIDDARAKEYLEFLLVNWDRFHDK
jgi:hypothetical protein